MVNLQCHHWWSDFDWWHKRSRPLLDSPSRGRWPPYSNCTGLVSSHCHHLLPADIRIKRFCSLHQIYVRVNPFMPIPTFWHPLCAHKTHHWLGSISFLKYGLSYLIIYFYNIILPPFSRCSTVIFFVNPFALHLYLFNIMGSISGIQVLMLAMIMTWKS